MLGTNARTIFPTTWLGLGSNLGDPVAQLSEAIRRLGSAVSVERVSSVYVTRPVGYLEQPDFWNIVCSGRARVTLERLHELARDIEVSLGRERRERNGPRTIDIDILAYGDLILETPGLTVPHPRLHERAFVLVPLAEIAPGWRHPRLGSRVEELLEALPDRSGVRRHGPLPGEAGRRASSEGAAFDPHDV